MSDWTAHAAELARSIGAAAPIRDRRWLAAVEQVPRHLFVPRWYERSPTGWVAAAIAPPAAPDPAAAADTDPAQPAVPDPARAAGDAARPDPARSAVEEAARDAAAATDPTGGSAIGQAVGAEPAADQPAARDDESAAVGALSLIHI